jgi:hypothetical protein
MTRADQLRCRADDLDNHATAIRWTEPVESRALRRIAADLREIADHSPPERGQV